jgi:hypothetical protein
MALHGCSCTTYKAQHEMASRGYSCTTYLRLNRSESRTQPNAL